jgi:hypothetical protein
LPITVKHFKVSDKADGQDVSLLQPSDWNEDHVFKVNTKSLVGNSTTTLSDADNIRVSSDFKLEDGMLSLDVSDGAIVTASATDDTFQSRVLTASPTVSWELPATPAPPADGQVKANVVDRSITLAKMELGPTGGEILYYDKTSKAPVRLPYGTKGMVLQTGTAEVTGPPVVDATNPVWGFSGFPHAVLQGQKTSTEGSLASGAWRTRLLATEVYDLFDLVLIQTQGTPAVGTNRFRLIAGTYVVEWSAPAFQVNHHQTRLYNITGAAVIAHGTTEYSNDNNSSQTRSVGSVRFTVAADKDLELQHQCAISNTANGMGVASPFTTGSPDVFSVVKIWRIS